MIKQEEIKYLLTILGGIFAVGVIVGKMCDASYELGKRS